MAPIIRTKTPWYARAGLGPLAEAIDQLLHSIARRAVRR